MLIHKNDSKWIIKSYLLHYVLLLAAQSQQTPTNPKHKLWKILLHSLINSLYFSSLNHVTISLLSHNRILDDITKGTTHQATLRVYTYLEVDLRECSSDWKSNFPTRKEYQLIGRTHKHIIPHSLKILE